jgi:hypothetical protein
MVAFYVRNIYHLGQPSGIDRGYVVVDVMGYRTILPVPYSVIEDLERAGVRRLGGKKARFKNLTEMRTALRKIGVQGRTS